MRQDASTGGIGGNPYPPPPPPPPVPVEVESQHSTIPNHYANISHNQAAALTQQWIMRHQEISADGNPRNSGPPRPPPQLRGIPHPSMIPPAHLELPNIHFPPPSIPRGITPSQPAIRMPTGIPRPMMDNAVIPMGDVMREAPKDVEVLDQEENDSPITTQDSGGWSRSSSWFAPVNINPWNTAVNAHSTSTPNLNNDQVAPRGALLPAATSNNPHVNLAAYRGDLLLLLTPTPNIASDSRKNPHPSPTSNYVSQKGSRYSTANLNKTTHEEVLTSKGSEAASAVTSNPLSDPPNLPPHLSGWSDDHIPRAPRGDPSNDVHGPITEIPDGDRGKLDAIYLTKCYRFFGEGEEQIIPQKVPKVAKDCQTSESLFNGQPVVKPPVDLRAFNIPQNLALNTSKTASTKSTGPPILSPQRNGDPLYESERRDRHRYAPRDRNSGPSSPSPLKKDFRDKGSLISFIRWCHMCSRDFPNRSAATRHKTKEHNKRHCPVCFLLLSTKGNIWKNHLLDHHDLGGEKVPCLYCPKTFNFDGLYKHLSKQHLKSHEDSLLNNPRPPMNQTPSSSTFSRNASTMCDTKHNQSLSVYLQLQGPSRCPGTTSAAATGPFPSTSTSSYASQPQSQYRGGSLHSSMMPTNPTGAGYRGNFRLPPPISPSSSSRSHRHRDHHDRSRSHRDHRDHRDHHDRSRSHRDHRDRRRHSHAKDHEKHKQ